MIFFHSLTFWTQHGLHYRGEDSRRSWSSQMFSEHRERPEAEILTKAGMVPIKITAGEEAWEDFGARRVKAVFWHEKILGHSDGCPRNVPRRSGERKHAEIKFFFLRQHSSIQRNDNLFHRILWVINHESLSPLLCPDDDDLEAQRRLPPTYLPIFIYSTLSTIFLAAEFLFLRDGGSKNGKPQHWSRAR